LYEDGTLDTSNRQSSTTTDPEYNEQGMSQDQKDDAQVAFILVTCRDMKQQYHLDKLKDILRTLRSSVGSQVFRELTEHYLALKSNRFDAIQDVNSYFATIFNQEEITRFQDDAAVEADEYVSSLEGGEESDSEPPLFEEDDESMLSSDSKGESDQDESFLSSTRKKRGRDDKENDDNDDEESVNSRPRKQPSRSSEAASDDESQDESQMHENDQDDDETEQSQSKATKQQEKEAKDKEKSEQQEKAEDAKYDALPEAWEQVKNEPSTSDKKAILAVVTNANDKLSDVIGALFDPSNPNRIDKLQSVLRYYMTTLLPSIRANSMLLSRSKAKVDGLASVVGLGGDASLSKFLLCCDSDNDEIQDEDPQATEEWERVRDAILECGTKLSIEEFLALGVDTRNMLMHFLHSQALQFIFSEITLSGLTAHLSAKASAALTSAMKELAQLVDPDAPFSLSMVVLSFMKQYALPGLVMNGARGKAIDVIIDIFGCLTCTSGRMSKEQTKAYKKNILTPFEEVDASTISGGRAEGNVPKYFSGDGRVQQDRRRNVVRLGLALYLKSAIEELLHMRDSGQYTRGILRLSASDITRKLSKDIKKTLFKEQGESQIKAIESMKKLVLKKKSTARTLLIESDEQMNCLMRLVNMLRTFSEPDG